MTPDRSLQCDVERLAEKDQHGNQVTMVRCHGSLVSETASEIEDVVKPLIASGGRTVVDLADVNYMDSFGLGALVILKVSAIKRGLSILEFANMTPRVLELLRLTHLTQMFTS
ncbi:STAS domain-containing protein [Alloacidobacterium dinghuense]|uniref:STAS domain-containing protein n=1 Tax=Alloacidobacterium dinghuense TaxID=2763107 RepID=A0A7G8BFU4_9BACT|nr:STAS domain-containing protein [Alloacidobacterium dinghuense]QNI31414.1 STAS domain-containing protein [Alloacidobacterium dinghuense]